ncbi:PSD1 and planctomycete cytochrome C domain-containing protein [Prosthecobacter sp. SYSU 5D2]|uniref:PSD1 and planctomycete cytochrome C domain-containing protein n=1 Tax=Prosthecobacter sp. SYSU 5D2 TaxID=3134134 RepID=UPI0031FF20FC
MHLLRRLVISTGMVGLCAGAEDVDYLRDIKPLLQERCYACHGGLKQKAGLRVDTVALMKQGGDGGNAIAGDHALILQRVMTADLDERMPPEGEGAAFNGEQIALLKAWIAAGAPGPTDEKPEADPQEHWAYHVPKASGKTLDELLAARLDERKLTAQPEAAPEAWLRRVYLDLIGLLPTTEQLQSFLAEMKAAAAGKEVQGRVVERLLASPQYGERWGRHFMDIWRYSDWYGLGSQLRYSQKHLWHWRDWIIESLNADKGYDEMIVQMLAADELAPEDRNNLRATGFLARSYYLFNRTTWLDETVEHTSRAFLGLTMQCVKCHDHKYDPVSHAEYYQMRAIFEPLHVRLDPWPGETDFEKNGLPRVFDLHLDRPTYRHIRGDDKNEDKSKSHPPGVPKILGGEVYEAVSLKLPASSVRPVLLPFSLSDHLAVAERALVAARTALAKSKAEDKALVEKALEAAQARPDMLRAVHAAEAAPGDKALAAQAAAADARYQLALAEVNFLKAQKDPALTDKDAKKKAAANKKLVTAKEALKSAAEKVTKPGEVYSPLLASLKAKEGPDDPNNAQVQVYPETSTGRRLALARWIASEKHPLTARVMVNHVWLRHFGTGLVADVSDFGRRSGTPLHQDILDTLAVRFMESGWSLKQLHREMVLSELYARSSSNAGADAATLEADPDNACYWRMNPRRMESQVVRDSLLHLAGRLDLTLGGPTLDPVKMESSARRSLYFNHTAQQEHRFLAMFDNANVLDCYRREESVVPQQALALSNSQLSYECAQTLLKGLGSLDDESFVRRSFLVVLGREALPAELDICLETLGSLKRELFLQALFNHNDFVTLR